ncbi:hypothetical protein PHLH4_03510 [Pseudomonas sp. St316]|nr:hypothetical protein PHLH4_03510 [Pseudomonas sp. St316]
MGARLARDESGAVFQKWSRLYREQALLPHSFALTIVFFERPQKRPFPIENGLSEVAKDRPIRLKFPPKNNNLENCAQVVLLVGFLL